MFQLNNEISRLKTELNLIKGESSDQIISEGNSINEKLHKRWVMISSEGAVFIGLLMIGFFQIRKTFRKEKELADRQTNFLLSVTHELKSPIASAKLQLQTLQKHELDKEKKQEIIANAISDTDRLNNLVENILLAAKIDNSNFQLHLQNTDLSDYIEENMTQMIKLFNYRQKVILDIEPGISLPIDRTSFPSIIINLFENAVKYSPPDSTITIALKKKDGKVKLSVINEGKSIAAEDKKKIFEKFYRVGNEDTRQTKGTGLGLYIVKHIVQQHNATIILKDNIPEGSIFEVCFNQI
jgi:signal transduction histidine kinase